MKQGDSSMGDSASKTVCAFRFLPLGLLFAGALLLSACGPRETLVQRGDSEQVLHRSIGHELADLDPALATQISGYHVLSAIFEGLVSEDPVDLHPVPGVAESWELSSDGRSYTFHLRKNARWSNGDPVTAIDFVLSYKRVLSPSLGAENASQLFLVRGAEEFHKSANGDFSQVGFEAPDAHTFRIVLVKPTLHFLTMLNQPVWFPVHVASIARTGPVTSRGTPWTRPGRLVGNGPFVLKEWSVNHRIVVAKSPSYWDAATVRLSEIHFYPFDIETEERAFRAGQLHMTDALPPSKVDLYRTKKPEYLRIDPLLGTYFYRLNTKLPSLASPLVRQALSLAVDRQKIVSQILRGGQMPAFSFTPPGMAGYAPPIGLSYDPEKARRLLAEAGYAEGKGLPTLDLVFNSSESHRLIAEAVQEMWRINLGVKVRLLNMENTSVLAARSSGDYQLLRSSWTADYADPQNFLGLWTTDSGNNFTGWSSPRYDALLEKATAQTRQSERLASLREAEALMLAESPVIPIYHYTHVFLLQPSVRGWNPTAIDHHPYKHVWLQK